MRFARDVGTMTVVHAWTLWLAMGNGVVRWGNTAEEAAARWRAASAKGGIR